MTQAIKNGKTYEYSYDQIGNQIGGASENGNGDGNRLTKFGNEQVKYDKDGNMTRAPLNGKMVEYRYNEFSQLVKAGGTEYTYDVNGNRASRKDENGTTAYVTDPNAELPRLLVKENPDGSRTLYVYGNGLIYMRARFYNPEIARFVNEDPIRDGDNWYAYCGDNPVNNVYKKRDF